MRPCTGVCLPELESAPELVHRSVLRPAVEALLVLIPKCSHGKLTFTRLFDLEETEV